MPNIIKRKRALLALSNKKKLMTFKMPSFIKNTFFGSVMNGDYQLKLKAFLAISFSIGLVISLVYYFVFQNILLACGVFIPSLFIYYCLVSSNFLISNRLTYLNEQRNFIEILESELTATTATLEAVKAASKHKLPKYLKTLMENIVKRNQLGDSLEEIIQDVESEVPSQDLKMAFAIIRINHKIGSSQTMNGLKEIAHNLEVRGDHVLIFKEKMSGQIVEKSIFYAVSLFAPLLMELYQKGYFSSLMGFSWGPWFLIIIFFISLAGQFIMENVMQKALQEL